MRDLVLVAFVFGAIPWMLCKPHLGVLMWSWLGYMNPHRLTWGFAYSFPFAQVAALCTLGPLLFCKDRQRFPVTLLTVLWGLLIVWMIFTTQFAIVTDMAWQHLDKVMKIHLIALVTVLLINNRERLDQLISVIVISIGYYGVKGGFFSIMTGGSYRVWGPAGSNIHSNNHLAVALLMILPLMYYLYQQAERKWVRHVLLVSMLVTPFSVAASHSRGAFLAGGTVMVYLWFKSKKKLASGIVLASLVPFIIAFMPSHWHERMSTIQTYDEDASAMGRIEAWEFAYHMANYRLTGGGFRIWQSQETFNLLTDGYYARAAHSIYFGVLGDHGWPGLLLFLGIGYMGLHTASLIIRRTRHRPDLRWLSDLARMIQVSMIAYASGGAFLSLPYFDLFWHLVSIIVIARVLMERELARAPVAQPAVDADPTAPAPAPTPARRRTPPRRGRRHPGINWGPARTG